MAKEIILTNLYEAVLEVSRRFLITWQPSLVSRSSYHPSKAARRHFAKASPRPPGHTTLPSLCKIICMVVKHFHRCRQFHTAMPTVHENVNPTKGTTYHFTITIPPLRKSSVRFVPSQQLYLPYCRKLFFTLPGSSSTNIYNI